MPGRQDHGHAGMVAPNLVDQPQAVVLAGQAHVDHRDAGRRLCDGGDRVLRIRRIRQVVPARAQPAAHRLRHQVFVFDD